MLIYLPLMVIGYLPFAVWEHLRHYLGWIVKGYWPLVISGTALVIFIACLIGRRFGMQLSKWVVWPLLVVVLGGIGVWGWNWWDTTTIPPLSWTRLGLDVLDNADAKARPRYEQARIIVDGTAPMQVLLTPHDLESLNTERRTAGYLKDDTLAGANFAVFESNEIWKSPRSVKISDAELNVLIGTYVVRDEQLPHLRMPTLGKEVKLPAFPPMESKYRLLVVLFPLDENASKTILKRGFEPETILQWEWGADHTDLHAKGH
jgi:hypothetical protein